MVLVSCLRLVPYLRGCMEVIDFFLIPVETDRNQQYSGGYFWHLELDLVNSWCLQLFYLLVCDSFSLLYHLLHEDFAAVVVIPMPR